MKEITIDGKLAMSVREVDTPEPGSDQVRIAVEYVGICGSDLHYYFEGANGAFVVQEPLVPGHELSGVVDLDPSGTFDKGVPVTVHPARFGDPEPHLEDAPHLWPHGSYLGSASTRPHTQGGMSQFLLVEKDMVRALPDALPVRRAVLAEPLGVALHAINQAGGVRGARVLVSGAGPIGLLAAAACKASGAVQVTSTDLLRGPLDRALAAGADSVIQIGVEEIPADTFDVVLECSGSTAAISGVLRAVRRRGTVVQVGMVPDEPRPVNLAPFISKEVLYTGTFRFRDEIDAAIELLAATPGIEGVVTHEFDLGPDFSSGRAEEAREAFETAKDSEVSGKVIVALPQASRY